MSPYPTKDVNGNFSGKCFFLFGKKIDDFRFTSKQRNVGWTKGNLNEQKQRPEVRERERESGRKLLETLR